VKVKKLFGSPSIIKWFQNKKMFHIGLEKQNNRYFREKLKILALPATKIDYSIYNRELVRAPD